MPVVSHGLPLFKSFPGTIDRKTVYRFTIENIVIAFKIGKTSAFNANIGNLVNGIENIVLDPCSR